ncbi:hypothetical protein AMELA_G00167030 [Ameiurus melas]|uniref:Uncharacterized protein n=1 Tax=Ameiurus melas TaxID=219545 RepID=A0A7J6AB42_AMEME|nr:hypothetical protein AMELA_G00167030 [Ameiurus melas]
MTHSSQSNERECARSDAEVFYRFGHATTCSKWHFSGLQRKTRSGNTYSATAFCTGSIYQNGVPRGNQPQHCCI